MLATRISFMNQIALFCERVGADVNNVRKGIGTDRRIGSAFLFPGPGYGGSCFPKDVKALIRTGVESGTPFDILEAVDQVNQRQKQVVLEKLRAAFQGSLKGKTVALWGLAFKAETDDMRESPAITLVDGVLREGGALRVHDPKAAATAREVFGDRVTYAGDPYSAATGADALAILTEWLVYRNPDFERLKQLLRRPLVVDGRNLYDPARMRALGFDYHGIGRRHP
jgi:UDPglucose 6-dehydrogenase